MNPRNRIFLAVALAAIVLPAIASATIDVGICGIDKYYARHDDADVEIHCYSVQGDFFSIVDVPRPIAIPIHGTYFSHRFLVEFTMYRDFYIQIVNQTSHDILAETGILVNGDEVFFNVPGADCNLPDEPISIVPEGLGNEVHWNEVHWNTPIKSAEPQDTHEARWGALKSIYR